MDSKFKANGILASAVDYFCLVCESRLYSENDAVSHIGKPVHTKNFELTNYFESRDDYVRKIKKWYFCELCNLLLSTATKVRLHVIEEKHIEYKNQRLLQRNGKFVVAFLNVRIHDKAWNGIIEETCVICNTEFEDEKIHVNETMHIIKLIQSKTEFYANKNVYRKTDDSSIQCLTCNMVFALSSLDAHFKLPEHIKLYQEAINSIQDTSQNDKKENYIKDDKVNNKQSQQPEKEIIRPVTETNITNKNINGESHKKNAKVIKKSDKEICEILNAKEYITKHKAQEPWCILCQWELELSTVKSHPRDVHHQTMLKLHKKRLSKLNANQITSLEANDKIGQANSTNVQNYEEGVGILDFIENFNENSIQINCEDQTAFCGKCSSSLNFNKAFIENHIKEHTKNLEADDTIKKDDSTNKQNTEKNKSILDSIENFQKNNIQINFEIQTAFCKKCSTLLDFKKNCIEDHIKEHNKALKTNDKIGQPDIVIKQKADHDSSINESIQHFKENNIEIHTEIQIAFCKKCSTLLNFQKKCIENHIEEHNKVLKTNDKIGQADIAIKQKTDHDSIKESIEHFQKNDIEILTEFQTAFCMKCSTLLNFKKKCIENHIEEHNKVLKTNDKIGQADIAIKQKTDHDSIKESIEHFQKNNIEINTEIQTAFCKKCSTFLNFKNKCIENHIEEHNKVLKTNDKIGQADIVIKQKTDQDYIKESIEHFQKNNIEINIEIQTAFCKKCSTSLDFEKKFIENHIEEHNKVLKTSDKIGQADIVIKQKTDQDYIKESVEHFQKNNIEINIEIQTAFCKKCSTSLDLKKKCIENHIEEHNKVLKTNHKIGQASNIKECIDDFQKHDIFINFELQTAYCKKCSISLDFDKTFIDNHIKVHTNTYTSEKKKTAFVQVPCRIENRKTKNSTYKRTSVSTTSAAKKTTQTKQSVIYTEEDITKIAEENDMTYMPKSKEVLCKKCNTKVPSFPTNLNEHVEGYAHKMNMAKRDPTTDKNKSIPKETINKFNAKKISLDSFVTSIAIIEGLLTKDVVINNRICINILGFSIVRKACNMLICEICKTSEKIDQLEKHLGSFKHLKLVHDSPVVDGDEFIREVQSIGFHCGYCNIFQPSWEDMQVHLKSYVHRDSKTSGQWRLQQYMPHIQKHFIDNRECFELHLVFDENDED